MPGISFCSLFLDKKNIKSAPEFNLFLITDAGWGIEYILHTREE